MRADDPWPIAHPGCLFVCVSLCVLIRACSGVQSVVVIEASVDGLTFSKHAGQSTAEAAEQLNIRVLKRLKLVLDDDCPTLLTCPAFNCTGPAFCPPITEMRNRDQSQTWEGKKTPAQVAREIAILNPDALIMLLSNAAGSWAIGSLFQELKALNWSPKGVSCGGQAPTTLANHMDPDDMSITHTHIHTQQNNTIRIERIELNLVSFCVRLGSLTVCCLAFFVVAVEAPICGVLSRGTPSSSENTHNSSALHKTTAQRAWARCTGPHLFPSCLSLVSLRSLVVCWCFVFSLFPLCAGVRCTRVVARRRSSSCSPPR